jgi:hypothetical protein
LVAALAANRIRIRAASGEPGRVEGVNHALISVSPGGAVEQHHAYAEAPLGEVAADARRHVCDGSLAEPEPADRVVRQASARSGVDEYEVVDRLEVERDLPVVVGTALAEVPAGIVTGRGEGEPVGFEARPDVVDGAHRGLTASACMHHVPGATATNTAAPQRSQAMT